MVRCCCCCVRCLQAWTYNKRAAIVLGVTEHNAAVCDRVKLHRLKQLLVRLVEKKGDAAVSVEQVCNEGVTQPALHLNSSTY